MGVPKGNRNALKHGLYARHYTPETLTELEKMSPEDYRMELAASRAALSRALDLFYECTDADRQIKLFNSCIIAFKSIINIIQKLRLATGNTPETKDLWESIQEANRLDKIPKDI